VKNADQADADGNGIGDACEVSPVSTGGTGGPRPCIFQLSILPLTLLGLALLRLNGARSRRTRK